MISASFYSSAHGASGLHAQSAPKLHVVFARTLRTLFYPLSVAADDNGNTWLAGKTRESMHATRGAAQAEYGGGDSDAFVAKLGPNGKLLYFTFLGGMYDDVATSLAVDGSGNAYVGGTTVSEDFPVKHPFQRRHGGGVSDAFIAKLSPKGKLVYSTYLGGDGTEKDIQLAVDSVGRVNVIGFTTSPDFPLKTPLDSKFEGGGTGCDRLDGGPDCTLQPFFARLDAGGRLLDSTYLPETFDNWDSGLLAAVDGSGTVDVLVDGERPGMQGEDVALVALGSTGSRVVRTIDLQPNLNAAFISSMAVAGSGEIYLVGSRYSSEDGYSRAFVAGLDPEGKLKFLSTFGGTGQSYASGLTLRRNRQIYVTGGTEAEDFSPIIHPLQARNAGGSCFETEDNGVKLPVPCSDVFVVGLNLNGKPIYGTYWGGKGQDLATGIASDSRGRLSVIGMLSYQRMPPWTRKSCHLYGDGCAGVLRLQ